MANAETRSNDDKCRLSGASSSQRRRSRYTVNWLQLLMMFCCWIGVSAAAVGHSETIATTVDEAVVWTPSSSADDRMVADRPPDNVDHGRFASLPRRDDASARDRHVVLGWRSLIAARRPVGPADGVDSPGRRPATLARPEVINNMNLPTTTTYTATAGLDSPAAGKRVNVAPVITSPGGRYDRLPRIQIRSTEPHSLSSSSAVFHALFQRPDNSYLITGASSSLMVDGAAGDVLSNSTHQSPNDSVEKYAARTANADDINTLSENSEKDASLEPGEGLGSVHRRKRQTGVGSVDEVDRGAQPSESSQTLDAITTSVSSASTESSTMWPRAAHVESVGMPLSAAALRYRSRGNFAALVDPVKSGRASASAGSATSNRWRHLGTASDNNSTSQSPVTQETTSRSAPSSSYNIVTDSDSIEIKVLQVGNNDSADAANSASVTVRTFKENLNSTLPPSDEWNCSKAMKSLSLQAALKLRMSDSAVALCVYTLCFLFTLVAAWAITGIIFSLCARNQRSEQFAGRRLSSLMVFCLVAMAAATRALHYVAAEYQLLEAVATPGGRRAIYECWFPFLVAAFFVHQQFFYGRVVSQGNHLTSPSKSQFMKRIGCRLDLCVSGLALCSYLMLVFVLCLLIEFCVVPVEAVFVLRFVFALLAVLLSAANIHKVTSSSDRRTATQVVLCALFVICAGFSAVDSAALLSDDFAQLFQQNEMVLIAVEAADRLSELFISVVLCVSSSSTFSRLQCEKSHKSINVGQKEVPGTTFDKGKVVNFRRASDPSTKSTTRHSWWNRLRDTTPRIVRRSKVVDVCSPPQTSLGVIHAVGWTSTEDTAKVEGVSPLPPPRRMTRSRSMLYNDHGFIRFRLDGDTDGESDARTLDDDEGGPEQSRSVPASEYASAESLSFRHGPWSAGTARWSRPGSPSLAGFRAPSIHLQDSIDRALDRCDIWRVGSEQGQLSVDELHRIVQLYADIGDCRRGNRNHHRRSAGMTAINYAEV